MTSGELFRIRFKFLGKSLDAVLDRLPAALVLSRVGEVVVVEAEGFGKIIKMCLLSNFSISVRYRKERRECNGVRC